MASKFETSINKMKASFDAIEAAKTHAVVLEIVPDRKTTGNASTTVKFTNIVNVEKPVEKPAKNVEYIKQPAAFAGNIATPAKKSAVKSSKLKKLLRGKSTFDCSAK